MAAICPSVSSKSKMSMFSAMRSARTDLGIATTPRWVSQRSTTWATDLPCFSPIWLSSWLVNRPFLPSANPPQDWICTPCPRMSTWSAVRWKNGWVSI